MNRTHTVYAIVFVGMAIWLGIEHRTLREQARQITALQQQLGQMTQQATRQNGEVSTLVAQARQLQFQTKDQVKELVELRDEVKVLHQQSNEIETMRDEIDRVRADEGSANAQNSGQTIANKETASNSSRLNIFEAYYWTPNRIINVTEQLRERVLGDKLEVIAGNDLRGDPEYGQVKTLTVIYSYDGVTMTNEAREGELMLIPEEQN